MVAATYDAAMVRVFADEGGYSNDLHDPGGPTNYGITIADARKYWKANATADDVRSMPKSVAASIYRQHYAAPVRYDDLPAGFDYSVFDAGINSGIGRAIPWAGKALGNKATTIDAVVSSAKISPDKVGLIKNYWAIRLSFLQALTNWKYFGKGWGRRCAEGEAAAVKMWLAMGAGMTAAEQGQVMQAEAKKATKKANDDIGKSVASGSGTVVTPAMDWSTIFGRILIAIVIAAAIGLVIYFVREALINRQRAAAYQAAAA